MPRIECPACEKQHNRADKAAACRAKKARELARRPDNTSRIRVTHYRVSAPKASRFDRVHVDFTGNGRELLERQARELAIGMTA